MNHNLKYLFLSLIFSFQSGFYALSQQENISSRQLNLSDKGNKIENIIRLKISSSNYESVKAITGEKITVKSELLIINSDTIKAVEIGTRGQTTLSFRRKSFTMKLQSEAAFVHGEKKKSLKKFFVISLSMDKYYCHNRLAFQMMEECKLFHLFYTFCELRINGQSEGVCMVVERPEDWALNKKGSPVLIRRGYNHSIEKTESSSKTPKSELRAYQANFREIYSNLNKYEGESLYLKLSELMDIDSYMKWIAFNYLVRNGDYTDEVYFYADSETKKFRIIPWDYDDLFSANPHEVALGEKKLPADKLIFSSEDALDKKIAFDPYLYSVYLKQFREILNDLSPEVLTKVFENTYSELYPYFSTPEILQSSRTDLYRDASLKTLQEELNTQYQRLMITTGYYLEFLKQKN